VRNGPLGATDPTGYEPQGLGGDDGDAGHDAPLGPDCSDPRGCVRPIFVLDPDGNTSSALASWNRSLQMFGAPNGGGQGGPDFGRGGHGGNPYSPNGVRHGNDSGQPGGSPGFTIEVSEDMCAEIAACSGGQAKRGPSRIWDAPIDEWAATAADIATDFVPGVAQAKSAYDAYDRIQNGEDPVDVLMAAGADAALGLIPGLKPGKKIDKALDKAEDVADAAGDVAQGAAKHSRTPFPEHGTFHVDPRGNTLPTPRGGRVTGSPDGKYLQVRDAGGSPTGVRIDAGHNSRSHADPRAQQPHGHVPGVANPDGTPWLPLN
jgi:hypothetical protein